ncbi:MAG: hypothetical protein ACFBSF_02275 [Leptolyngbyaceae cyanobacterium]
MSLVDSTIGYRNTDLELVAAEELTPLVKFLASERLLLLQVSCREDGFWSATFETAEQYDEPELSIVCLLDAIESLPEALQARWSTCTHREFDIGYDCGNQPWAFNQELSSDLLNRMANVGVSLRITLYPPESERNG